MDYRFGGLIFGGVYFRNFMVYFLNRRNTTVPNRRVEREPWEQGFLAPLQNMADGIDLTDVFARLRNSLLDLSRRLQCNASEDMLDFVSFRLKQIL